MPSSFGERCQVVAWAARVFAEGWCVLSAVTGCCGCLVRAGLFGELVWPDGCPLSLRWREVLAWPMAAVLLPISGERLIACSAWSVVAVGRACASVLWCLMAVQCALCAV